MKLSCRGEGAKKRDWKGKERGGVPYVEPNLMTQSVFLTTLMEVLSTPRCKPEPPKTVSPMPEAGFLTTVVLSMLGSIVEPINNSTEGQVRGELGPLSGEPVL